jgi:hypothetical protein
MPILATETWWLTQDGDRRVPEGDPRAAVLLIHKDCPIPESVSILLAKLPVAENLEISEKAVLNPPSNKALMLDAEKRKKA